MLATTIIFGDIQVKAKPKNMMLLGASWKQGQLFQQLPSFRWKEFYCRWRKRKRVIALDFLLTKVFSPNSFWSSLLSSARPAQQIQRKPKKLWENQFVALQVHLLAIHFLFGTLFHCFKLSVCFCAKFTYYHLCLRGCVLAFRSSKGSLWMSVLDTLQLMKPGLADEKPSLLRGVGKGPNCWLCSI